MDLGPGHHSLSASLNSMKFVLWFKSLRYGFGMVVKDFGSEQNPQNCMETEQFGHRFDFFFFISQ